MRNLYRLCLTVPMAVLLLSGCATSDDPREGGLIGYMQHGERGYQRRLDERRALLAESEAATLLAEQERATLEARRETARERIAEQEKQSAELAEELVALRALCEGIRAETDLQRQSRRELEEELLLMLEELDGLRAAPPSEDELDLLFERQRRLAELERELNLLRERASLLTTL